MRGVLVLLIMAVADLLGAPPDSSRVALVPAGPMPISAVGYSAAGDDFFFWGDGLYRHTFPFAPGTKPEKLVAGSFMEGGFALDVNGDGQTDVVIVEARTAAHGPALVWYEAPQWKRHVIDPGVDSRDLIPATLFGRRGILLIHKRMQVRFYEIPANPAEAWPETEIYSFYTPSEEAGLALADVNGDGRVDILAGNYFIESPAAFELPWHLWAIDVWTEVPHSATLRVAWLRIAGQTVRVAIQREMSPARFAWFEKPSDFRQLWTAHPVGAADELRNPCTLLTGDLAGNGADDLLVAECASPGRLILYRNRGSEFSGAVLASGHAWRGAFRVRSETYAFDDRQLFRVETRVETGAKP